jgi:hypothetical protein
MNNNMERELTTLLNRVDEGEIIIKTGFELACFAEGGRHSQTTGCNGKT